MYNVFEFLRWQDFLDIVLLSLIFYRILLLVKGTRTMPMLMGFGLILVLYLLANLMHLQAVGLLLDHLASSIVLVLIILFQTDIRNALAQFGLITFFRDPNPLQNQVIESVLQACNTMSRQRIGALIVFEREVGLRNFVEKGAALDATVDKELLLSIFHPSSPLHDGAVIIDRNGRLAAARCLLPVSMSTELSAMLGTRHRAAVGLSEETDAVVLVVSEERSEVSLSFKGEIIRDSADHNIKQLLSDLLGGKVEEIGEKEEETPSTTPAAAGG